MSTISIIIPHYNGYDILNNCLKSLYKSKLYNAEIIIVNNNSTDNSIDKNQLEFPEVVILNLDYNRGYAGGCNYGSTHAKGEFLVFLNNDTEVSIHWLTELMKTINNDSNISSVQPKILNKKNETKFDYAGASGGFIDKYCYPFTRGRIFNTIETDTGQYNDSIKIFWASGTGFITRRSLFKDIGGFDEQLFAHMEEIDYHWKCQLQGYSIYINPTSIIYHLGGETLSYNSPYKTYLNHRNSLLLLLSNYNISNSIKFLFPRLFMELISTVKDLLSLRFLHSLAQLRAIGWIIIHPKIISNRRSAIKKIRKISDDELLNNIILKESIVYKYFINNQKEYSDL